jgi:hypothetical protein
MAAAVRASTGPANHRSSTPTSVILPRVVSMPASVEILQSAEHLSCCNRAQLEPSQQNKECTPRHRPAMPTDWARGRQRCLLRNSVRPSCRHLRQPTWPHSGRHLTSRRQSAPSVLGNFREHDSRDGDRGAMLAVIGPIKTEKKGKPRKNAAVGMPPARAPR